MDAPYRSDDPELKTGLGPRPELARWATFAGIIANIVLVVTFFGNWTWQSQLGLVLPFGLVWFVGWWRWQKVLGSYEDALLEATAKVEANRAADFAARRAAGQPAESNEAPADWEFELRYGERRALEKRAEALREIERQREWKEMSVLERWRARRS